MPRAGARSSKNPDLSADALQMLSSKASWAACSQWAVGRKVMTNIGIIASSLLLVLPRQTGFGVSTHRCHYSEDMMGWPKVPRTPAGYERARGGWAAWHPDSLAHTHTGLRTAGVTGIRTLGRTRDPPATQGWELRWGHFPLPLPPDPLSSGEAAWPPGF